MSGTLPGPRLWQAQLTLDAARRGLGVALTNRYLAGDDFEQRRLLVLTSQAHHDKPVVFGSYVFWARADRWQTPAVTRFRSWLRLATAEFRARRMADPQRAVSAPTGERL